MLQMLSHQVLYASLIQGLWAQRREPRAVAARAGVLHGR